MKLDNLKKWFPPIFMFTYAIGLLIFSIIYWIQLIGQDLWHELPMRIIVMVLTIGAVCCFALSKVLHNQKKIVELLKDRE